MSSIWDTLVNWGSTIVRDIQAQQQLEEAFYQGLLDELAAALSGGDLNLINKIKGELQLSQQRQTQLQNQKNTVLTVGQPPNTSFTQDELNAAAAITIFLMTKKGKEVYQTIEPLLDRLIQAEATVMTAMFHSAAHQPVLGIPAILLFTSFNDRIHLIDHGSAANAYAWSAALLGATDAVSMIASLLQPGLQSIGFSSPRFLPSAGASAEAVRKGVSSGAKGHQSAEEEADHTRGE